MSLPLVQVDVASAAYGSRSDPAVIQFQSEHATLLALFDGAGSWGYGMEAAAWTRLRLTERWRHCVPGSMDAVADDIEAACEAVPRELRDADFGCGFSGVAVLIGPSSVHVAAAGLFGVSLVNRAEVFPLFRPRMLTDRLLEEGHLRPDELDAFAHQDVHVGPVLVDGGKQALERVGPRDFPPEHILIVAYSRLLRLLATQPPASWMNNPAAVLQRTGTQSGFPAHPTIMIRRADRAHMR